jgi:hypothetical protein
MLRRRGGRYHQTGDLIALALQDTELMPVEGEGLAGLRNAPGLME